ncbi:MAG: phospho-N-acetylmuramoyl-pentapeptide-transferase [Planctomycetaceae bacterium]|nr:phospho-N-acetylmuramoyl-pentapeptide-transferase [Planctomycetaceae bacterium]
MEWQALIIGSAIALVWGLISGPGMIRGLKRSLRERIVSDSARLNQLHAGKQGTPTMGGVIIFVAFVAGLLPLFRTSLSIASLLMLTAVSFCLLGAADDWIKARRQRQGLTARQKLLGQIILSTIVAVLIWQQRQSLPDCNYFLENLVAGSARMWIFVPWAVLVLVAVSNSVNLTDGLDGLATGCSIVTAGVLAVLAWRIPETRFVSAGAAILASALMAFLFYNRHPAKVFMGDAGSLQIGAVLGVLALASGNELALLTGGLVFVVETLSVILQVGWYRRTKRKILLCSPLHNHFVFQGISERRIVAAFWLVAAASGLATILLWP